MFTPPFHVPELPEIRQYHFLVQALRELEWRQVSLGHELLELRTVPAFLRRTAGGSPRSNAVRRTPPWSRPQSRLLAKMIFLASGPESCQVCVLRHNAAPDYVEQESWHAPRQVKQPAHKASGGFGSYVLADEAWQAGRSLAGGPHHMSPVGKTRGVGQNDLPGSLQARVEIAAQLQHILLGKVGCCELANMEPSLKKRCVVVLGLLVCNGEPHGNVLAAIRGHMVVAGLCPMLDVHANSQEGIVFDQQESEGRIAGKFELPRSGKPV